MNNEPKLELAPIDLTLSPNVLAYIEHVKQAEDLMKKHIEAEAKHMIEIVKKSDAKIISK